MHTGRGHRKLRFSSKKHYERDKYAKRSLVSSVPPTPVADLRLSVPLSYFTEAPLSSLDMLHSRVSKMDTVTQGIDFVI